MKQKHSLILILLAFLVLFSGAYILYNKLGQNTQTDQFAGTNTQATVSTDVNHETEAVSPETAESETESSAESEYVLAPDFTVYDIDGNEVHLSDFIGKPIILNFWASWCGPCKMEMPDFDEAYAELGEEIHFLMVNVTTGRETLDSASKFIEEQGYSFPVFYDTESDAASTYGAYSLPTTYFIDKDGYAITYALGAINRHTLQRGIDMIYEISD
ncbi:MAG: TlpA family protein disulfide reductase [Lachnoclostridium sp.]|nr:TlpA family protein disulfide reductase [Lachnoclostridium sp.]